jgi:hypothetical protein
MKSPHQEPSQELAELILAHYDDLGLLRATVDWPWLDRILELAAQLVCAPEK